MAVLPLNYASEMTGLRLNTAPDGYELRGDEPKGFADFYLPLHERFTPRQQDLVARRKQVLEQSHRGRKPDHLPPSQATESNWKIALPAWIEDQRNQMTGPADDAELCVKMLNSGAPGVMLDLEDSMANEWEHLQLGISNVLEALHGSLNYFDKKRNRQVTSQPSKTM